MDRRTPAAKVADALRTAIVLRGTDAEDVARAAGMPVSVLNERLNGVTPFTYAETVRVGGFLRLSVPRLIEGIAA
jgi:hypothetical protein